MTNLDGIEGVCYCRVKLGAEVETGGKDGLPGRASANSDSLWESVELFTQLLSKLPTKIRNESLDHPNIH